MLPTDKLPERFIAKVVESDSGCWLWTASCDQKGYGFFWVGNRRDGRMHRAHRFAYEAIIGPVPEGLVLDHLCRTRHCVNPAHLEPVTAAENTRRGEAPAILLSQGDLCSRGHVLDRVNKGSGSRYCRVCQAAANRRYRARKRAEMAALS